MILEHSNFKFYGVMGKTALKCCSAEPAHHWLRVRDFSVEFHLQFQILSEFSTPWCKRANFWVSWSPVVFYWNGNLSHVTLIGLFVQTNEKSSHMWRYIKLIYLFPLLENWTENSWLCLRTSRRRWLWKAKEVWILIESQNLGWSSLCYSNIFYYLWAKCLRTNIIETWMIHSS